MRPTAPTGSATGTITVFPPRTLYEIRHTFFALSKSLPLELVKLMAGHSKSFASFDVYGGELEDESQQLSEMIDQTVRCILDDAPPPASILSIKGSI